MARKAVKGTQATKAKEVKAATKETPTVSATPVKVETPKVEVPTVVTRTQALDHNVSRHGRLVRETIIIRDYLGGPTESSDG